MAGPEYLMFWTTQDMRGILGGPEYFTMWTDLLRAYYAHWGAPAMPGARGLIAHSGGIWFEMRIKIFGTSRHTVYYTVHGSWAARRHTAPRRGCRAGRTASKSALSDNMVNFGYQDFFQRVPLCTLLYSTSTSTSTSNL